MLAGDAVALRPRSSGVDRHAAHLGQPLRSRCGNDFCMGSHEAMMHYASFEGKCLLHHRPHYRRCMQTPNDRLKATREKRYDTAVAAAEAIGVPVPTYIQHESGRRGSGSIPRKAAERYAAFFKVSLDWLLSGKGEGAPTPAVPTLLLPVALPNAEALTAMFRTMLAGLDDLGPEALAQRLAHDLPASLAQTLGVRPLADADTSKPLGATAQPPATRRPEAP